MTILVEAMASATMGLKTPISQSAAKMVRMVKNSSVP